MAVSRSKKKALKDRALSYLGTCATENDELIQSHIDGLSAYMQDEIGNEVEGRSQVVMSDVADTIEWVMPSLMKIFYGGHKVLNLEPVEIEDEVKAPIMEEKVNFDMQKGLNGYLLLHDWFKDALIGKYSVVKYWWERGEKKKHLDYTGVTVMELEALYQEEDITIKEVTQNEDLETFDVKCTKLIDISKPMAVVVPPEEMIVDVRSGATLSESSFVAHKKRVHKNHLKKYGLKPKDVTSTREEFDNGTALKDQRFEDLGGSDFIHDDKNSDFVYIYECYLDDYDEEGDPIPMKVVIFGNKAISAEENTYGKPPFCGLTAVRIPHRFAGRSLAELVFELQKLKTALIRSILDNLYYQNNGVTVVNPYRINMDDVIDRNEPGAKWRTLYDTDPKTAFAPVPVNPMAPQAFQLLSVVDEIKEKRTGITSYNQGLDSKSLNKTATGISQIMGASQQRMELIARMFAETGVRELFQAFVDMNLDFFDREQMIKVGKEWAQVNPQDIDGQFDVTIEVGVGTGSQEIKINQLTNMLQMSAPMMEGGVVSPEDMQALLKEIYLLMGHKNTEKFVSGQKKEESIPPEAMQQMQQQMQQMQEALQKAQKELQDKQAEHQLKMGELKLKEKDMLLDKDTDDKQLALKEKELVLKYTEREDMKNDANTAG